MIYTLTAIIIAQMILIAYCLHVGRKERQELEDRLMAITQPVALTTHQATRDFEPGEVSYVDEAREAELSPSWNASP